MEFYTSQQVVERVTIPYRILMRWVKQAVYRGQSQKTLFSKKDFQKVTNLALLWVFLGLRQFQQALAYLHSLRHNLLSIGAFAVVQDIRGERILFKFYGKDVSIKLLRKGPGLFQLFPVFNVNKDKTNRNGFGVITAPHISPICGMERCRGIH